jgi:hypothetical protein
MIKLILAPIRSIVRFPLLQLAFVIGVILWLQAADDKSIFGKMFNGLDKLVDATVQLFSAVFTVKSFTKSWLISGFMIAYVYLAGSLILFLVRLMIIAAVDFVGRSNLLYLRNAIARERGIEAYCAWIPLERIRPAHISQQEWEQAYAWPVDNKPPYPPLGHRIMRGALSYGAMILIAAFLLQFFTPFPVLTWIFGWPAAKSSCATQTNCPAVDCHRIGRRGEAVDCILGASHPSSHDAEYSRHEGNARARESLARCM